MAVVFAPAVGLAPDQLSNGAYAQALIQEQLSRLVHLQAPVSAGESSEALHQMRVVMRRLRATLNQFEPALCLPAAVNDQRVAKWVRRLGMARDLDVLRGRLEHDFLPQLPEAELEALRPVRKQLRRERELAHGHVGDVLRSRSYLEGLAALQGWVKQPAFTLLGHQPIREWVAEWAAPVFGMLFLHPGWQLSRPSAQEELLHELRREIKEARYQLENLAPVMGSASTACIVRLKKGQALLGELNDLHLLERAIQDQLPGRLDALLPQLDWLLTQHQRYCWEQWRDLVNQLLPLACRRRLRRQLVASNRFPFGLDRVKAGLRRLVAGSPRDRERRFFS